jgi:hypothetical protein
MRFSGNIVVPYDTPIRQSSFANENIGEFYFTKAFHQIESFRNPRLILSRFQELAGIDRFTRLEIVQLGSFRELFIRRGEPRGQRIIFDLGDRSSSIRNFHLIYRWTDLHQIYVNERAFDFDDGLSGFLGSLGSVFTGLSLSLHEPSLLIDGFDAICSGFRGVFSLQSLPANESGCDNSDDYEYPLRGRIPIRRLWITGLIVGGSLFIANRWGRRGWILALCGCGYVGSTLFGLASWGKTNYYGHSYCGDKGWFHFSNTVPQKYLLTSDSYWGTVIAIGSTQMANVLDSKKQAAIISALAEGSSIRSIERITDVHRDTI